MNEWLDRFKPAATARTHLMVAASVWTLVGSLLAFFGIRWLLADGRGYAFALAPVAVVVGLAKGHYVLPRTSTRVTDRIRVRGDGRCIGGFLSVRMWLLVAGMVLLGRLLRGGLLPLGVVGLVYLAIGTALVFGSRRAWRLWADYEDSRDA